jgi:serine/threonine-protein kinase RsbW
MDPHGHVIRIELPSSFELLDLVQILSDRVSGLAGLDEDATHWVSVAVRESVINAIKHGNREDRKKHVTVEFLLTPRAQPQEFVVQVLDEGEGFDPDVIANPLDPENVLNRAGRGIFFARSFGRCLDRASPGAAWPSTRKKPLESDQPRLVATLPSQRLTRAGSTAAAKNPR